MSSSTKNSEGIEEKEEHGKLLNFLTPEHHQLMLQVKEYWIDKAFRYGSSNNTGQHFKIEDIRKDIEFLYKRVAIAGKKEGKPTIFAAESYAAYQIMYNLLKVINEDKEGRIKRKDNNKNILANGATERFWDIIWFGAEGQAVHEIIDATVKKEVQSIIWESMARGVGDAIGMNIWNTVRQNLSRSLGNTTWAEFWSHIAGTGMSNDHSVIGRKNGMVKKATNNVWKHIMKSIAEYMGDEPELERKIGELVSRNNNKLEYVDHFLGLGNWGAWITFYDFFYQAGIMTEKSGVPPEFLAYRRILDKGVWTMSFFDDCVLVCTLPTAVRRDPNDGRLHSLEGPAIEWKDGTGQYYLRGVSFSESLMDNLGTPPKLWQKLSNGSITFAEVFMIENVEQRYVALRIYGPERLMRDAGAVLTDKSKKRGNELYKVEGGIVTIDKQGSVKIERNRTRNSNNSTNNTTTIPSRELTVLPEMRLLRYNDPYTKRPFMCFVPEEFNKADEAMAWTLEMTESEYVDELKVES